MEIEVERGREAMDEEDERGRGLCDSEIGDELPVLDYLWACGRVRQ